MAKRIYNFSAGPAILPEPVLEQARDAILDYRDTGIGIMEHSHRSPEFQDVIERAEQRCRELAGIPADYSVLFLQGGASLQFSMVPANLLPESGTADYIVTGSWSKKAVKEAARCGEVHLAASGEAEQFRRIPTDYQFSPTPAYAHFTSNNTICGTQFAHEPPVPDGVPLVCDASSDIFSRPLDVTQYGLIYAGAQKNLGPSGVTLVIARNDLIDRGPQSLGTMLQYRTHAQAGSLYNTPPTFAIFVLGLVLDWIAESGGLAGMAGRNQQKAGKLYEFLDQSRLFQPVAEPASRSLMNVTFVTGDADLDARFIADAKQAGFDGLKGHRSVGGMRASIYNAFPPEGVDALIDFMREFEQDHSAA